MNILLQRFHQLTEREKRLVIICGVAIIVGAFYWIVWSPMNAALEKNQNQVVVKKADLAWLKKQSNKAIQLRGSASTSRTFTGSLPQAVNQTASRLSIAISRMQPQGEVLRVWVDQAPFNDVLTWLQSLENMGVRILDIDMAKADNGHVKIRSLQLGKS